jgi:disulfide bond formation protein DsbB
MADVTDTTPPPPASAEEEDPLAGLGSVSFFLGGMILGFLAAAAIGIVVLMALDPLGPSERVALESTSTSVATAATTGGGEVAAGDPANGEAIFAGTCATCHGPDAEGIPGLGLPLVDSEFVRSMTDAELIAFIEAGRQASDGTTGVAMPPKGGNPSLTNQDIADVVAFLSTLQ